MSYWYSVRRYALDIYYYDDAGQKSTSLCAGCCDTLAYSLGCKWTLGGRCQCSQFSRHHFD